MNPPALRSHWPPASGRIASRYSIVSLAKYSAVKPKILQRQYASSASLINLSMGGISNHAEVVARWITDGDEGVDIADVAWRWG